MLFPEVDALYGVPQRAEFHPEVDTGVHVELVLDMAARLAPGDDLVGFCALTHDLGKALTPADVLPRHIGHEHAGVAPLRALASRLRVPAEHAALAEHVCRFHLDIHRAFELRPETLLSILERVDAFRTTGTDRAVSAGLRGRQTRPARLRRGERIRKPITCAQRTPRQARSMRAAFVEQGLNGPAIGEAVRKARVQAIAKVREAHAP